jgi:hypothetical protein
VAGPVDPGDHAVGLALQEDAAEVVGRRLAAGAVGAVGRPGLFEVGEPPRPFAPVAAVGGLLDEAVFRELAQVERAARLRGTEVTRAGRGGGRAEHGERLDQVQPQRMGERPHRLRICDTHKPKISLTS